MAVTWRAGLDVWCNGGVALLVVLMRSGRGVAEPIKKANFAAKTALVRRQTFEHETE